MFVPSLSPRLNHLLIVLYYCSGDTRTQETSQDYEFKGFVFVLCIFLDPPHFIKTKTCTHCRHSGWKHEANRLQSDGNTSEGTENVYCPSAAGWTFRNIKNSTHSSVLFCQHLTCADVLNLSHSYLYVCYLCCMAVRMKSHDECNSLRASARFQTWLNAVGPNIQNKSNI